MFEEACALPFMLFTAGLFQAACEKHSLNHTYLIETKIR